MLTKKEKYNIAIVGATGLVGKTFIQVLEDYHLPVNQIRLYASTASAGRKMTAFGKEYVIEILNEDTIVDIDVALFSAGGVVSKEWAPKFASRGALVIDNSSAWRMEPHTPLVVPEVNSSDIVLEGIIANPNCSTIQAVLPLKALEDAFGLVRVNYATYQAVSGSGQKGIDDYHRTMRGEKESFYPLDISKTCIPEIDRFMENGYTFEEMKMVDETRKILSLPKLPISATCIRVPIEIGHGVLVKVTLKEEVSVEEVRTVFDRYPGIILYDDPFNHQYPNSIIARGKDEVFVGRIRKDLCEERSILFYTVADNVRKGAASNAIQILAKAIEKAGGSDD